MAAQPLLEVRGLSKRFAARAGRDALAVGHRGPELCGDRR